MMDQPDGKCLLCKDDWTGLGRYCVPCRSYRKADIIRQIEAREVLTELAARSALALKRRRK